MPTIEENLTGVSQGSVLGARFSSLYEEPPQKYYIFGNITLAKSSPNFQNIYQTAQIK